MRAPFSAQTWLLPCTLLLLCCSVSPLTAARDRGAAAGTAGAVPKRAEPVRQGQDLMATRSTRAPAAKASEPARNVTAANGRQWTRSRPYQADAPQDAASAAD